MHMTCPGCALTVEDDFELLDTGELHQIVCERCHGSYYLLLFECDKCLSDNAISWLAKSGAPVLSQVACHHCAAPIEPALRLLEIP